jgi:hypothetical protein
VSCRERAHLEGRINKFAPGKRGVKDENKVFDLNNWKDGAL